MSQVVKESKIVAIIKSKIKNITIVTITYHQEELTTIVFFLVLFFKEK